MTTLAALLTLLSAGGDVALIALVYFLWRLERRVYKIELHLFASIALAFMLVGCAISWTPERKSKTRRLSLPSVTNHLNVGVSVHSDTLPTRSYGPSPRRPDAKVPTAVGWLNPRSAVFVQVGRRWLPQGYS